MGARYVFSIGSFLEIKFPNLTAGASEISAHRLAEATPSAIITFHYHIRGEPANFTSCPSTLSFIILNDAASSLGKSSCEVPLGHPPPLILLRRGLLSPCVKERKRFTHIQVQVPFGSSLTETGRLGTFRNILYGKW